MERENTRLDAELILRHITDGLMIVDPAGRITYANESFCRMVGRERQELERVHSPLIEGHSPGPPAPADGPPAGRSGAEDAARGAPGSALQLNPQRRDRAAQSDGSGKGKAGDCGPVSDAGRAGRRRA